jgi:hypothetical protein
MAIALGKIAHWKECAAACIAFCATTAFAQSGAEPRHFNHRGGFFAQLDIDLGGDKVVFDEENGIRDRSTGEGEQIIVGGFYQPWQSRPVEIYLGGGIKRAHLIPCGNCVGEVGWFDRSVLEVRAQYRFTPRWYAGGGVVHHWDIWLQRAPEANLRFKPATGILIEGGWSYLGLHATYMEYKPRLGGRSIDASSVGIRMLFRF